MTNLYPDFQAAVTHLYDAEKAQDLNETENLQTFLKEAQAALCDLQRADDLPYYDEYHEALVEGDVDRAKQALANLAAYVRDYDGDEYTFYTSETARERAELITRST